jgi:hypothetical protein
VRGCRGRILGGLCALGPAEAQIPLAHTTWADSLQRKSTAAELHALFHSACDLSTDAWATGVHRDVITPGQGLAYTHQRMGCM